MVVTVVLFSSPANSRFTIPFGWQPPPDHQTCFAFTQNQLLVSAAPDFGTVAPTVIVPTTTLVSLKGIAQRLVLRADCTVDRTPLTGFSWRLTFQPAGGVPGSATAVLQHANTLLPSFNVGANVGAYEAQLIVGTQTAQVRIEVAPQGRAWYTIGPDGWDSPWVGRINILAFDPSHPSTMYAGSGRGGVWRSPDRGLNWWPMSDQKIDSASQNTPAFNSLGIGALAVAFDGTIYAGVGDWPSSNTIGFRDSTSTLGIVKSSDGGIHWMSVGTTAAPSPGCVAFTGQAQRIVTDPSVPSLVYVAASNGLFRSFDGGSCWRMIFAGNFSDAALDPTTPTSMFVAALPGTAAAPSGGIIRLDNVNVSNLMVVPSVFNVATFTPSGSPQSWLRIVFRFAPSDPQTAYAVFVSKADAFVAKSNDHLRTLSDANALDRIGNPLCTGTCGPRNSALAVSPNNPDLVFYGGSAPFVSSNGGTTWTNIGSNVHSDQLWMTFAPDDSNTLYLAGDGGISSIPANSAITTTWTPLTDDLGVAQSIIVASAPANWTHSAFGSWDTGTQLRSSGRSWTQPGGGDGFNATFDASNDENTFYADQQANNSPDQMLRFPDGLSMGASIAPFANPLRAGELFHVGLAVPGDKFWRIYATRNANSSTTTPAFTCVDPSPSEPALAKGLGFLSNGSYYLNYLDGSLFTFKLPVLGPAGPCSGGTSAQSITQVLPANNPGFLNLAVDPFDANQLYGLSIGAASGGTVFTIPLVPNAKAQQLPGESPAGFLTGAIAADPKRKGVIYLGTLRGLLVGAPDNAGQYHWSIDPNLPDALVTWIDSNRNASGFTGQIQVSLYGRGIWQMLSTPAPCGVAACLTAEHLPIVECLTCPSSSTSPKPPHPWAHGAGPVAMLVARFNYRGDAGPTIYVRAVPLSKGVAMPFFVSEIAEARVGDNEAPLTVFYAAEKALIGVHSDAIRFELFARDRQRIIATFVLPFDHWWLKPTGRLISVAARETLVHDNPKLSLRVPIQVEIDGRLIRANTPFIVPANVGSHVRVSVSSVPGSTQDERREQSRSIERGKDRDRQPQARDAKHEEELGPLTMWTLDKKILKPQRMVEFSVQSNQSLVGYYFPIKEARKY